MREREESSHDFLNGFAEENVKKMAENAFIYLLAA